MKLKKVILVILSAVLFISVGCGDDEGPAEADPGNNQENLAPNTPGTPYPENFSYYIPQDVSLSWTCSDPNNDPLLFDIYMGESPNTLTLMANGLSTPVFSPPNLDNGKIYFWKIIASDPDDSSSIGPMWMFGTVDPEAHFLGVPETGSPYAIIVNEAEIDGVLLQDGDEIGVFDDRLCVGSVMISDTTETRTSFTVWEGDDAFNLVGYQAGNPMIFKIWSIARQEEFLAEIEVLTGGDTFESGPYSAVNLTVTTSEQ